MLMIVAMQVSHFFFFKQKTAYGMRISDWSSDVCSSDLVVSLSTITLVSLSAQRPATRRSDDDRVIAPIVASARPSRASRISRQEKGPRPRGRSPCFPAWTKPYRYALAYADRPSEIGRAHV